MKYEKLCEEFGLRKRWLYDKSGYYYERVFKTKLGKITLTVDIDDPTLGKSISITIWDEWRNAIDVGSCKLTKRNLEKWIQYLANA